MLLSYGRNTKYQNNSKTMEYIKYTTNNETHNAETLDKQPFDKLVRNTSMETEEQLPKYIALKYAHKLIK